MRLAELKDYDKKHKCLTPGAIYSTTEHDNELTLSVKLPKNVSMPEKEEDAKALEVDLHYAAEKVLKRLFKRTS